MILQKGNTMSYNIIFYKKENGESDVLDFLEKLRKKATTSKDARIQYNQAVSCIDLLSKNGTLLPSNITKHIDDNIWELRPGNNRIFYFYVENNTFVLLHVFRKKTQKTPKREIAKAKFKRNDYLARKE